MINLGSHKLPLNAATKTFGILAKRGAGKSYCGGVIAEELYKNKIPFVVFDPIDVWWGLRFNKNGKDKGLPIVVFGLEHADIKLDREMGKRIAQSIIKNNISCIISTFGMPKVAQRHLITEFSEEILNINNSPRHIFIEEAHEYIPQRVFGALGKTFNAVSNLIVMGRNRGIGVTILNQRAATVNKDVLTQIDTLIVFRNIAPQDRNALKEWVEYHAAKGDFEKFMKSLPTLPTGEGWIWSPEFLGIFEKIKIRQRETYHPDREKLGDSFIIPPLEQTDVQEFINQFSQQTSIIERSQDSNKLLNAPMGHEGDTSVSAEIIILKNEYESKLMQKDIEIKVLQQKLNSVRNIVGQETMETINFGKQSIIKLWQEKLGNSGARRIFDFLSEKFPMKFIRSQIGLVVGLSSNSGSFSTYMSTLKRNKLIIEQGGYVQLNPDL